MLKHINNNDVAIEIIRKFYVHEKQMYEFKVRWWNIGKCHTPYYMGIEQKIAVSKQEAANWVPYEGETA